MGPYAAALAAFRRETPPDGWPHLSFFRDGAADLVAAKVDARFAAGATVLPDADHVFNALRLTPLERVKAVILGQDPYPTPGDAHGLAFSYVGRRRLPPSLKVILAEMAAETRAEPPRRGDLSPWAREGVLLLNTALTVEAGASGAHLRLGWAALTEEALAAVSARQSAVAFLLWGNEARKRAGLVDRHKHLVLESGHPSPLNRLDDFRGTRPFTRANEWLVGRGVGPVDWGLDTHPLPSGRGSDAQHPG